MNNTGVSWTFRDNALRDVYGDARPAAPGYILTDVAPKSCWYKVLPNWWGFL